MAEESRVLIRKGGPSGSWTTPATTAYDNEDHLQSILTAAPGNVPGVMEPAFAVRELRTTAGPVDVCIVDAEGHLTVVECKLSTNSDRRRMVIGQLVDYAAAIWSDGASAFLQAWSARGAGDLPDLLSDDALANLRRSIDAGQVSLCLAVDQIDGDLRRLVEFLNRVAIPEVAVTAIQLAYVREDDLEVLIPTTFGGELAEARVAPAARHDRWTRELFLDALADENDRLAAAWLMDQVERTDPAQGRYPRIWYGVRPGGGVFLNPYGRDYSPIHLSVNTAGRLMLYGHWDQFSAVKHHPGFEPLARLMGLDHRGPQKGVPVANIDHHQLWEVALRCSETINTNPNTSELDS